MKWNSHVLAFLAFVLFPASSSQAKKPTPVKKSQILRIVKKKKYKKPPVLPKHLQRTMKKLPVVSKVQWQNMVKSIQKVRSGVFVLPPKYTKNVNNGLNHLAKDASIVPHFEKGVVVGFKFLRVRKGGAFQKLEVQSKDILLSINGYRFVSPQHAMQAYTSLKQACKWKIALLRKGKPISIVVLACK